MDYVLVLRKYYDRNRYLEVERKPRVYVSRRNDLDVSYWDVSFASSIDPKNFRDLSKACSGPLHLGDSLFLLTNTGTSSPVHPSGIQ